MFGFFKKRRLNKYTKSAKWYVLTTFKPEEKPGESWGEIQYKLPVVPPEELSQQTGHEIKHSFSPPTESSVRYSDRDERYSLHDIIPNEGDNFAVASVKSFLAAQDFSNKSRAKLDNCLNLSFVEMVCRYIAEKGWRDSRVYKAAQMDRRLFSKMMSNLDYKPSKDSALALAIALELTLKQTNDLLSRAGYTLSHSDKRDVVIEYFIREGIYNLSDINEVLYRLDQKIIGR